VDAAVGQRLSHCRSCGGTQLQPAVNLGEQPFANSLLYSMDEGEKRFPLELCYCETCSLVQLTYTPDPRDLFSNYVWVTGTSSTARREAVRFCEGALARTTSKPNLVIEIASNDGTFLRPFQAKGIEVLGIDPAKNLADQANAEGVPTVCAFYGEEAAHSIRDERGAADIVFARNVLPHVANLQSFLRGIAISIGDQGLAVIEVHDGGKILEGLQYDSIYHEHLCYFTLKTLEALLRRVGLQVVDVDVGPIGGGALLVFARKQGVRSKPSVALFAAREEAAGANSFASWKAFGKRVRQHRNQLSALLIERAGCGRRTVGYGASARSSTMLNFCGVTPEVVSEIADAAPLKQGLFTAGTRIPIRSPDDVFASTPDTVLLLAWNFRDEIVDLLRRTYKFRGQVIYPLPGQPSVETLLGDAPCA
jgi:C-methyltransferase C-terminal domain/Methyltransferase domain/Putative zinc binding domain